MTTNGTALTIPTLTTQLQEELRTLDTQIATDEVTLRGHREQAAFVRGKLALLSQLVLAPTLSGDPIGETIAEGGHP